MKKVIAAILLVSSLLLLCACGKEPREVRTAEINEKGELVIIFTDGTRSNVGMVKGERGDAGENGADGKDGENGKDGVDGKDGEAGDAGQKGSQGVPGRSILDVYMDENGALVVVYSDSTTANIELNGGLYLFGGKCGENVSWGLYSGGLLVISGEGATEDYSSSPAPWTPVISMISAVIIDSSRIEEGEGLLDGIDPDIIKHYDTLEISYVDMTDFAPVYSNNELTGEPLEHLPACTEIYVVEKTETYTKIMRDDGTYGYISFEHTRKIEDVKDTYSMIYDSPMGFTYIKPKGSGAMNMRSFPDATGGRTDNIKATIGSSDFEANGALADQEGIKCTGVSRNGNWYRVAYKNMTLYVYKDVVDIVGET